MCRRLNQKLQFNKTLDKPGRFVFPQSAGRTKRLSHKHTWKHAITADRWRDLTEIRTRVLFGLFALAVFLLFIWNILRCQMLNCLASGTESRRSEEDVSVCSLCFHTRLLHCAGPLWLLACSASLWLTVPSQYVCLFLFEWSKPKEIWIYSDESSMKPPDKRISTRFPVFRFMLSCLSSYKAAVKRITVGLRSVLAHLYAA